MQMRNSQMYLLGLSQKSDAVGLHFGKLTYRLESFRAAVSLILCCLR